MTFKLNKKVFDEVDVELRQDLEGFRPGLYVRMELKTIPATFVQNFNCRVPYLIGGLLSGEQNVGFVQVSV